ncbi:DUF2637 domain-containing protein [Nocardia canadensis]|uniref:DUF2637 domain-containing protein n=1 Tax=Nocardia canadensis TaxID=3065238 RepID=UPI00292EDEBB|nr:DUF2637 domain-containing protein [Nocardia canadensis]
MSAATAGAVPVRSEQAAHRSAPSSAQPAPRDPSEVAAVRFFWGELILVAVMSIGGNAVHAWLNAPPGMELVAAVIATFPPIALLAATHGVGLLVRARSSASLAYWAVVVLTFVIAVVAFRLSFDALRDLAVQVGMSEHLAWLFPVIIDGAIGQATVALLVLARKERTAPEPLLRTDAHPVHSAESVRTVAVREVHTETRALTTETPPAPALGPVEPSETTSAVHSVHTDRWAAVAEIVCGADPAGRRDPEKVAEILRLRHDDGLSHARIAERVEVSASTVTRTLSAAAELGDNIADAGLFTVGGPQ